MTVGVFESLTAEALVDEVRETEELRKLRTAQFNAKERFGAYLANSRSRSDFDQRVAYIRQDLVTLIADSTEATPGTIRKVIASLKPEGKGRPTPGRLVREKVEATSTRRQYARQELVSARKHGWVYDEENQVFRAASSEMAKFACPGCGHTIPQLGFNTCKCGRVFNSWKVQEVGGDKTANAERLYCREVITTSPKVSSRKQAGNYPHIDDVEGYTYPSKEDVPEGIEHDCADGGLMTSMTPASDNSGTQQFRCGDCGGGTTVNYKYGTRQVRAEDLSDVPQPGDPDYEDGPSGDLGTDLDGDGISDPDGEPVADGQLEEVQQVLQDAIEGIENVQQLASAGASDKAIDKAIAVAAANAKKFAAEKRRTTLSAWERSEAEFQDGWKHASIDGTLPDDASKAWLEGYVAFLAEADSYSDRTTLFDGSEEKKDGIPISRDDLVPADEMDREKIQDEMREDYVDWAEDNNAQGQSDAAPSQDPGIGIGEPKKAP